MFLIIITFDYTHVNINICMSSQQNQYDEGGGAIANICLQLMQRSCGSSHAILFLNIINFIYFAKLIVHLNMLRSNARSLDAGSFAKNMSAVELTNDDLGEREPHNFGQNSDRNLKPSSTHALNLQETRSSKIIKEYYLAPMMRAYEQAQKKIPNPVKILQNIREKEKKYLLIEKQLKSLKSDLQECSMPTSRVIQIKTTRHSLSKPPNPNINQGLECYKILQKNKITQKLTSSLEQLQIQAGLRNQQIEFASIEVDDLIDEYLAKVLISFTDLKRTMMQRENERMQMEVNKIGKLEQKYRIEIERGRANEGRLREKLEKTLTELNVVMKEKMECEKSIAEMRREMKRRASQSCLLNEDKLDEGDADTGRQNSTSRSNQFPSLLTLEQQTVIKTDTEHPQAVSKSKYEKSSHSHSQILKTQPISNPVSVPQSSESQQIALLKQEIRELQIKNKSLQNEHEQAQQANKSEELKLEKFIRQWRDYLNKIVEDYESRLKTKTMEIEQLRSNSGR